MVTVVGIEIDELHNDMSIQAKFFRVDEELTLLKFEPVTNSSAASESA